MRIATEATNVFSGSKSVEFILPVTTTELGVGLIKTLNPEQDTVYMRMYHKFDPGYSVLGSNHNGFGCQLNILKPLVTYRQQTVQGFFYFFYKIISGVATPERARPDFRIYTFTGRDKGLSMAIIGILMEP
jgi:hypothetical protein